MLPVARTDGIITASLPEEVMVYDLEHDEVHCLNTMAAWVWNHCDGETSVDDLARGAASALDVPADPELVLLALHHLGEARLLAEPVRRRGLPSTMTRREVTRKLGLAGAGLALGIPVITTLAAPTPLHASSHFADPGEGCTESSDCNPIVPCCRNGVCMPGGGPRCA